MNTPENYNTNPAKVAKTDWMRFDVNETKDGERLWPESLATAHAAMLAARKAKREAVAALPETKVESEATETFEASFAAILIERGIMPQGFRPIVSRFGQVADPARNGKVADKASTASGGKRSLGQVVVAKLYGPDGKAKAETEKTDKPSRGKA